MPRCYWWGYPLDNCFGKVTIFTKAEEMHTYDPAIPVTDIYTTEMFKTTLSTIVQNGKHLIKPSTVE